MKKILIIGAGPTGLAAGCRLKELGHENFRIYERSGQVGGLCAGLRDPEGFSWDRGGHVLFSKYDYVHRLVDDLLGQEVNFLKRDAWIFVCGRFVRYPFQNNLEQLPPEVMEECRKGLLETREAPPASPENFKDWILAEMGPGIARHFMLPYNFKVWAHPLEEMGFGWIADRVSRVKTPQPEEQANANWGPNALFKYPKKGFGEICRAMARRLEGRIVLQEEAAAVDMKNKTVNFTSGRSETYEALINTAPLDLFCEKLSGLPEEILKKAGDLKHNSLKVVGIGLRRKIESSKTWVYFPGEESPFNRVTFFSNYSRLLVPDADCSSLLCEVTYSPHKPVAAEGLADAVVESLIRCGMISREDSRFIVSRFQADVPYAYPLPTLGRDAALQAIQPFLERHDLYSRGRFGSWRYETGNTDHAIMLGKEIADRLISGAAEKVQNG